MHGLLKYFGACGLVLVLSCLMAAAHDYSEFSMQIPANQQLEMLTLLQEIMQEVETPPAPAKARDTEFADDAFERAQLLTPRGRELLLKKLEKRSIGELFRLAPYASYLEALGELLFEYETAGQSQDHAHPPLDAAVEAKLKQIKAEVDQWLD